MAVLILGYGNPLGGDDAVGWHAAETLASLIRHPAVRVQACHQLTPELAAEASQAAIVIFLDAAADQPPGTVHCRRVLPERSGMLFTHQLSPAALLGLTERLYGRRPEAVLFSVGAHRFTEGAVLSSQVRNALPALLDQVCELVRRVLAAPAQSPSPKDPQEPEADIFSVMH